tara:strand:- start:6472 stop:6645 length:174 start_codon:yes stop_codon:yes gene_type:complete
MTKIILNSGKVLNVRASVSETIKNYNDKPNTEVLDSRINNNFTIWINGTCAGEIVNQ